MLIKVPDIPKMKGEENWTIQQQLMKVREEADEAIQAPKDELIYELGDVLHSVWILWRLMMRDLFSPNVALDLVIKKNRKRGYYDENENDKVSKPA